LRLVEILASGAPAADPGPLPAAAAEVGAAYTALYGAVGFLPPWIGYYAVDTAAGCVGTCGFKGRPEQGRVEIAYFTFPEHERRGFATAMARALVAIASVHAERPIVAAQTLPVESASTAILRKLGFVLAGSIEHPDDGEVWEWRLPPKNSLHVSAP